MKTPEKISFQKFQEQRRDWIAKHCKTADEFQLCRTCNSRIQLAGVYFSIHDARFENCAGAGAVMRLIVPFCPKCEPEPAEQSCLHETPTPIVGSPHTALFN